MPPNEMTLNVVPAPPVLDADHNGVGADRLETVVSRLVRDLESMGRNFVSAADSSGELVLDVREMIMRSLFSPQTRQTWLVKLLPPGTDPLQADEALEAFKKIVNQVRAHQVPVLVRVENKGFREPTKRLCEGWEDKFYRVCLASLDVLRNMGKLNAKIDTDTARDVLCALPKQGVTAKEINEAFGLSMPVLRIMPQLRGRVCETVSKYLGKFERGDADDTAVLLGGTFFELIAMRQVEELEATSPGIVHSRESSTLKNARRQILGMTVTQLLEFIKEASISTGRTELANVFQLEEDGIFNMADDLRKAQRLLKILTSGQADEESEAASDGDQSESSGSDDSDSTPESSKARKHLRWKEQVRSRLRRKVRDESRRKRTRRFVEEIDDKHGYMGSTKSSWNSTPSSKTSRNDVVYVIGPDGRWIQADVISVKPGADLESSRVWVTPRNGLDRGDPNEVLMYSDASVHSKVPGSCFPQYAKDLDKAIKAKFGREPSKQSLNEAEEEQEVKKMTNPTAKMALKASLTVGKTKKCLIAWEELAESRQLCDDDVHVRNQASRYWKYIQAVESEFKEMLTKNGKKETLRWAWKETEPSGRGLENRWVALALVLGKPKYCPPHADPELELHLAAKRELVSKFALYQWGSVAVFFWLLLMGILLCALSAQTIFLLPVGLLLILIAPPFLAVAFKAHQQFRKLIVDLPVSPPSAQKLSNLIGKSREVEEVTSMKPVPKEAWT